MARHVERIIRIKKQEVAKGIARCRGICQNRYFSGRLCRCYTLIIIAVPIVPGGEGVRQ
ncbi:hypothetical protein PC1_0791 [Pectobacterium carotovorum subsp. carotovorum PC1]|uniref:Uncharacterized protein n=1 Tax=Pectobacterium carotovorum subsp. carotovorum (strain PC1) TaxID=561230 RepID=C6D9Q9_PECCP|nr:hypothetical protein PC1_0791 [Pectobacterium carotovorum subsp. carotovorum PC1]